jgi:hypothetical protein
MFHGPHTHVHAGVHGGVTPIQGIPAVGLVTAPSRFPAAPHGGQSSAGEWLHAGQALRYCDQTLTLSRARAVR